METNKRFVELNFKEKQYIRERNKLQPSYMIEGTKHTLTNSDKELLESLLHSKKLNRTTKTVMKGFLLGVTNKVAGLSNQDLKRMKNSCESRILNIENATVTYYNCSWVIRKRLNKLMTTLESNLY